MVAHLGLRTHTLLYRGSRSFISDCNFSHEQVFLSINYLNRLYSPFTRDTLKIHKFPVSAWLDLQFGGELQQLLLRGNLGTGVYIY